MYKKGKVVKIEHGTVKVKIIRESACGGNCEGCGGCTNKELIVDAKSDIPVNEGDFVLLGMNNKAILKGAFLVYILPLVFLFVGYAIAFVLVQNQLISALSGFLFMVFSYCFLHRYDKKTKEEFVPKVVSLVNSMKE